MKKITDIEKKFYERIGIKQFRKAAFALAKGLLFPSLILIGMNKEERKEAFNNTTGNYRIKKGHGKKDLEDFIPWLYVNGTIHASLAVWCLLTLVAAHSLGTIISNSIALGINLYCIMLQRYNYIRIKEGIEKYELRDQKRRVRITNELEDKQQYWRKYKSDFLSLTNNKEETYDEFIKDASLEDLRKYRDYLRFLENSSSNSITTQNKKQDTTSGKVFKKGL